MNDYTYDTGYPTEPISRGNPYHCCAYCKVPVPQINGNIKNHEEWCEYRKKKESNSIIRYTLEYLLLEDDEMDHLTSYARELIEQALKEAA